jgi:hypothetical protein
MQNYKENTCRILYLLGILFLNMIYKFVMMAHEYKYYVSGHYPSSCIYLQHSPVFI